MRRTCSYPNCTKPAASKYARLCAAHRARERRHGAPDQVAISKKHLAPFLAAVRARIRKNPESSVWAALDARWAAIVTHCEGLFSDYHAGIPTDRNARRAASEVIRLAESTAPRAVVETALAMILMHQSAPHMFSSDAAFRTQVVRRVRSLADQSYGQTWNHHTGKVKRYYRDIPRRAVTHFWNWLRIAFGSAAIRIACLEEEERRKAEAEGQAFKSALGSLR